MMIKLKASLAARKRHLDAVVWTGGDKQRESGILHIILRAHLREFLQEPGSSKIQDWFSNLRISEEPTFRGNGLYAPHWQ